MARIFGVLFIAGLWFLAAPDRALAQDEESSDASSEEEQSQEPAPSSPELQELQLKLSVETALKDIAEAQLAAAKAAGSETRGLEGAVTVGEGAGYFAEILAYDSVGDAASIIAAAVEKSNATKVIITNRFDLNKDRALWRRVDISLQQLEASFTSTDGSLKEGASEACKPPLPPDVIPVAPFAFDAGVSLVAASAALGALADVIGFFRTDTQ
jgi:hypothetical protein